MADVLGRRLGVPRYRSAAYGAALLAGLGASLFTLDASGDVVELERTLTPGEHRAFYDESYYLFREADRLLAELKVISKPTLA